MPVSQTLHYTILSSIANLYGVAIREAAHDPDSHSAKEEFAQHITAEISDPQLQQALTTIDQRLRQISIKGRTPEEACLACQSIALRCIHLLAGFFEAPSILQCMHSPQTITRASMLASICQSQAHDLRQLVKFNEQNFISYNFYPHSLLSAGFSLPKAEFPEGKSRLCSMLIFFSLFMDHHRARGFGESPVGKKFGNLLEC